MRKLTGALSLLSALLLAACGGGASLGDGGNTTGGGGGGGNTATGVPANLTIEAAQTSIIGDGASTSLLTATLTDTAGVAMSGVELAFETNAGTLTAATATTDSNGRAITRLKSSNVLGRATVTVRETGSGLSANTNVVFAAGAASQVSISLAPAQVKPADTTSVSVLVTDTNNLPVSGELVELRNTANPSGGQFTQTTLTTDDSGRATTTYTAGSALGTDILQASLAASGAAATDTASLTVSASAATITSIVLTVGNSTAVADGAKLTTLSAKVTDSSGDPVAGSVVNFGASAGTLLATSATTNAAGVAQVSLRSPTQVGSATVTASTAGLSTSGSISFIPGAAKSIVLSASPSTLAPGEISTVRATVFDAAGNRVPNITVAFNLPSTSVANGGRLAPATGATDGNGEVDTQYTAPSTGTGDTITAKTTNGLSTNYPIVISTIGVGSLTLEALTDSIPADGSSQTTIRATVTGTDGNPLSGKSVSFTSSAGTPASASVNTDASGHADFVLTAGTTPGTATVKAAIGAFSQTVPVEFTAGAAKTVTLAVNPSSVKFNETATLIATVVDAQGHPISGVQVNFSVIANNSQGTLAAAIATTNASGVATTTYTAGSTSSGFPDQFKASVTGATAATAALSVTSPTQTVSLVASTPQLLSSASTAAQGVTLTATVKDSNNNVVPGVTVQFAAKRNPASSCGSGGALQVTSAMTDASGAATAVLFTGGDPINQIIDVTASASGVTDSLSIPETGTVLTINGASSVGLGTAQSYTINLKDAGNNPIGGQALSVTSTLGNVVSAHAGSSFSTDANGQIVVDYKATVGGSDTLTVKPAGCASYATPATQAIQIAAQTLTILAPTDNTQIPFSAGADFSVGATIVAGGSGYVAGDVLTIVGGTATTTAQLTVTSVTVGGVINGITVSNAGTYSALPASPASVAGGSGTGATFTISQNITVQLTGGTIVGQTIEFHTTRGVLSAATALTDGSGVANVTLTQPSGAGNAGGAVVTASCTSCAPMISSSTSVQFNATTPSTVSVQATPSNVPINGTSVIVATVRDAANNPAANQTVQFTLVDDSGGTLLQSSAETNASGQATISYQAGGTTSSQDGVQITGTVAGATSGVVKLTVGGQSLRIVLGTGNTISEANTTQYQLPYSVLVTDAAGNPPPAGSVVNLRVNALSYQKGKEVFVSPVWSPVYAVDCSAGDPGCAVLTSFGCQNEDAANLNGILDTGEDYNGNTKLDPGNPASVPTSVALDASGSGQFNILYPQDRSNWVEVQLTATISVNGDQGRTSVNFVLPGLSDDFTDPAVSPPGQISPYGTAGTCADPS